MTTEILLTEILIRIGKKLHDLRLARNEKIHTVAIGTGKSETVISQVENGRYRTLSIELLCKLAIYYQVNISVLLSA